MEDTEQKIMSSVSWQLKQFLNIITDIHKSIDSKLDNMHTILKQFNNEQQLQSSIDQKSAHRLSQYQIDHKIAFKKQMQTPSQRVIPFGEELPQIQPDPAIFNNTNKLFGNKMSFHSSEFNRNFSNNFNIDIDLDKLDQIQKQQMNQDLIFNKTKSYQKPQHQEQLQSYNFQNHVRFSDYQIKPHIIREDFELKQNSFCCLQQLYFQYKKTQKSILNLYQIEKQIKHKNENSEQKQLKDLLSLSTIIKKEIQEENGLNTNKAVLSKISQKYNKFLNQFLSIKSKANLNQQIKIKFII